VILRGYASSDVEYRFGSSEYYLDVTQRPRLTITFQSGPASTGTPSPTPTLLPYVTPSVNSHGDPTQTAIAPATPTSAPATQTATPVVETREVDCSRIPGVTKALPTRISAVGVHNRTTVRANASTSAPATVWRRWSDLSCRQSCP